MTDILFVAHVRPHGKGRPRTAVIDGHARIYTPSATSRWESDFAAIAQLYAPAEIMEGPVRVDILAINARPKRLMRARDPDDLIWAPGRPDADNIRKSVLDALKAWWNDDSQIVAGETLRVYAEKGGAPRLIVRIQSIIYQRSATATARALGLREKESAP